MNRDTNGTSIRWEDFCRKHGENAARQFAKEVKYFVDNNPVYDGISSANIFAKKFIECFNQTFTAELINATWNDFSDPDSPGPFSSEANYPPSGPNSQQVNGQDQGGKPRSKFNFKHLFKRSNSANQVETQLPPSNGSLNEATRSRPPNLSLDQERPPNEVKKDGILDYLVNLDSGVDLEEFFWQKCRVLLYKAPGGFMLEFYAPPKAAKPKNGIFCFLIHEARPATILEMPDGDHVFVIKAVNKKEYMLRASNKYEMNTWLDEIRHCMEEDQGGPTSSPTTTTAPTFPSLPTPPDNGRRDGPLLVSLPNENVTSSRSGTFPRAASFDAPITSEPRYSASPAPPSSPPPALPPRSHLMNDVDPRPRGEESHETFFGVSNETPPPSPDVNNERVPSEQTENTSTMPEGVQNWISFTGENHPLAPYPWFHGTLSRLEASHLVSQGGQQWHGIFLIRQSETRQGDYVLTFNFQGRAKHLRLSLNADGHCRVQHLWFPSLFDMLEHFRSNPIPLESGGPSDVMLTNFCVNTGEGEVTARQTLPGRSNRNEGLRRSHSVQASRLSRTAVIQGGSVRLPSTSANQHPIRVRAVENHYAVM
ncbi:SH2B adapter 1-like [Paramuricea clavata]|uniref:SH2B adapter 1-like n=3 Tax=Paramuricea clavata TaxID=317549 RepID=A0A6S7FRZ7_PARCT|nr:SH2B adapter 1-like [Paramuricea clavata]